MNNYRNIYRISKDIFTDIFKLGMGPYSYWIHKIYEREGKTFEDIKSIRELMYSKERWYGHKYDDNIREVLDKFPVFKEQGCFSTFLTQRPGPWDDPLMKYNLRKRFGSREKMLGFKPTYQGFGFDSEEQMGNWFNDPLELKALFDLGFIIRKYRVKEKDIIFGLKQVWVIGDENK
jgi:hypothetical protein